jgi:type IV secretion system protein VirD4
VRRAGLLEPRGVVLGKLDRDYLRHDGEEHVALVGPTRSGKGVDVIIPTLLTWRGSVIVTDPKDGENYDVTAGWRGTLGPVYAFTPHRPGGVRINVLDSVLARLKTRDEFRWAYRIGSSLVAPEKMAQENHTSLHFRELAALLLTAVILHVCYTAKRKSLAGVWEFMTQQHDSLDKGLKAMATTAHVSGGVHQAISAMTKAIKNITGDRELSSVWSTAIRPLVIYNDDWVASSTDTSDFDLHALQYGDDPVSLYLIAADPLELELLHPLYRVVLDVTLGELMGHKVRTWKHRLLNVVDEMPAYGYTRAFEKGIPVKAGYGMKDLLITQDLESLWEVYGRTTAIWGNCKVKVFFTPDNDLTAKRISDNMLGDTTVEQQVRHEGGNPAGKTSSVTYQYHGRRLLTPDEVMDLPADKGIARIGGIKPILFDKFDYRFEADFQPRLLPVPQGPDPTG